MQIDPDALPDDTATLHLMLRTVLLQQGALAAENDKLRLLIQCLTRHRFGRRSVQLTPDELQLALEELERRSPPIRLARIVWPPLLACRTSRAPRREAATTAHCRRTCLATRWW